MYTNISEKVEIKKKENGWLSVETGLILIMWSCLLYLEVIFVFEILYRTF